MQSSIIPKFFHLTIALSASFLPLWPSVILARSLIVSSQYPEVQNSDTNALICYLQTPDGVTLDLDNLCQKRTENDRNRAAGRAAVDRSSGSNLGANQCYVFDTAGRPCTAPTSERQENKLQPVLTNPTSLPEPIR